MSLVPRDVLLRRLDRLAALTVIRGLPGTGKTTLAADWARRRHDAGDAVVWIGADAELNASEPLLRAVWDGLIEGGLISAPHGTPAGDVQADSAWARLAAVLESTAGRVLAVIDDAHLVDDPELAERLAVLLSRTPALHLTLCSQAWHPAEAAVRARGLDTVVLSGADLTVTADELGDMAGAWGHPLSQRQAAELHGAVGGWLRPAQLVLDNTPPDAPAFDVAAARAHVRECVLPRVLGPELHTAAARLAPAARVTDDLVRRLLADDPEQPGTLGGRSPRDLIVQLAGLGVLEPVPGDGDGDGPAWRFPVLVGDVLVTGLSEDEPDAARHVHRSLAGWYADRAGDAGRAAAHARAGEDYAALARLWLGHAARLVGDPSSQALSAYGALPADAVERWPVLALTGTVIAARRGGHEPGSVPSSAQRVRAGMLAAVDISRYERVDELLGAAATAVVAHLVDGDVEEARRVAARADQERSARGGDVDPATLAWFWLERSTAELLAGEAPAATELSVRAFQAASATVPLVASAAAFQLALLHAVDGATAEARRWLEAARGAEPPGTATPPRWRVPGDLAAALLALDQLDEAAARQLLACAEDSATDELWPYATWVRTQYALVFGEPLPALAQLDQLASARLGRTRGTGLARHVIERCTADLLLAMGEVNRAQRRIAQAGGRQLWLSAPAARLRLMAGQFEEARRLAAAWMLEPATSLRDRAQLLLIKATAAQEMGDDTGAVEAFHHARTLAEHMDSVWPYLLVPRETFHRFGEIAELAVDDTLSRRIAAARRVFPARAELVDLSPRELAVLYELARQDTIADIARTLTVSVNTVKKQVASAYAKLGVHDRAAALLRAHRLGLLPGSD